MDQGVAPSESVIVEQVCGSAVRARTVTDLRGSFVLELNQDKAHSPTPVFDASDGELTSRRSTTHLAGCELRAVLGGYISTELQLTDADQGVGSRDIGTISLRRISGVQGSTISVTSILVPDKARKEYEKALKDLSAHETKRAQEHLLKAVKEYPKYAAAWVSLGELNKESRNNEEARADFGHALEADPNYLPPYIHLAYLAAADQQWQEVLRLSDEAIRLDPLSFPDLHYLSAAANFNLHHMAEARRAAIKAAEIDQQNRIPRIHYLLGMIYESSGERELAAKQFSEFLKLVPNSNESAQAQRHLDGLAARSATAEKD